MRQGNILNVRRLHFTDVCLQIYHPHKNVRKSRQLVFANSSAEPDKCLTFSASGLPNNQKLQMDYEIQLPQSRSVICCCDLHWHFPWDVPESIHCDGKQTYLSLFTDMANICIVLLLIRKGGLLCVLQAPPCNPGPAQGFFLFQGSFSLPLC